MQVAQDYYRVLGVAWSATAQQIKKAYRALAFRYHPDQQPDNPLAAAQFLMVQEAYEVLSQPAKRARYDEERWLRGFATRKTKEAVTPAWLAAQARKLREHIGSIDTYRMQHGPLRDYVLLLLEDAHLAILQTEDEGQHYSSAILEDILAAISALRQPFFGEVTDRLRLLEGTCREKFQNKIDKAVERHKAARRWQTAKPWLLLLAAALLCMLMYWYVARN